MSGITPPTSTRRRTLTCFAAIGLAGLATALGGAPPAHAGTYTIWACKPPGKTAHTAAPFQPYAVDWAGQPTDNCKTTGRFGTQTSGASFAYASRVGYRADAPVGIAMEQLTAWGSAQLGPAGNRSSFTVMSDDEPLRWDFNDVPPLTGVDFTGTPLSYDLGDGARRLEVFLSCHNWLAGTGAQPCAGSAGFGLTGVELLLSESALPTITNDGGSLVSNTIHSGTERVYFTATDADSGVAKVEVLIDDRVVATRDYTTTASCAFETWQACEPNQADALDVNTTTIANGQHSLALRATDAAGNRKATTTPMTIQVANPTPGVPPAGNGVGPAGGNGVDGAPGAPGASGSAGASGSVVHANGLNASASAALQAQFVTNKGRRIKARYGRVVPISGRLVGPNGRAVAGAKLDVLRQIQTPGSPMTKVGEVVTDSRGAFTYEAPIGPSRRIRFAYRAFLESVDYAQTSDVDLQVTAAAKLGVSKRSVRNRSAITFRGTLLGAPAGSRKVIEMQAKVGRKWQTFDTARAGRGGRFALRYRFTRTTSTRTYTFRARIRTETGFPYLTGYSNRVNVRVRP